MIKPVNILQVNYFLISIVLLFFACKNSKIETGINGLSNDTKAQWIQDGKLLPASDSLFYLDDPAPLFRKEFVAGGSVEKATLYITSAGYYKATLNAMPVGMNVLDPAWTDYSKRIYYSEYDVTSLMNSHYHEYPGPHMVKRHYGIRTDRYKLIHFYYDVYEWDMHDLQKDLDEIRNISAIHPMPKFAHSMAILMN